MGHLRHAARTPRALARRDPGVHSRDRARHRRSARARSRRRATTSSSSSSIPSTAIHRGGACGGSVDGLPFEADLLGHDPALPVWLSLGAHFHQDTGAPEASRVAEITVTEIR
ncbi:MAG: hypothetical protein M5U28_19655 [Sandaracinaceae bacterium]|nr:hypothetical protein [Sandaracinaceae bacterium]